MGGEEKKTVAARFGLLNPQGSSTTVHPPYTGTVRRPEAYFLYMDDTHHRDTLTLLQELEQRQRLMLAALEDCKLLLGYLHQDLHDKKNTHP